MWPRNGACEFCNNHWCSTRHREAIQGSRFSWRKIVSSYRPKPSLVRHPMLTGCTGTTEQKKSKACSMPCDSRVSSHRFACPCAHGSSCSGVCHHLRGASASCLINMGHHNRPATREWIHCQHKSGITEMIASRLTRLCRPKQSIISKACR